MSYTKTGKEIVVDQRVNQTSIRAVEITDIALSAAVAFAQYLKPLRLYEWWLTPENSLFWSQKTLDQVTCNCAAEVLAMYHGESADQIHKEQLLKSKICASIEPHVEPSEFEWNFSVMATAGAGDVISILFGDSDAMDKMYSVGHRRREKPRLSLVQ